ATGVDGCGAPLFALTLAGLARAFRVLVLAAPGTPERRVADAMRAHPKWTSGTSREERKLMDAVPGLLIKGGAEGVDAFALSDGRAGAVKIDDGAHRGRTPASHAGTSQAKATQATTGRAAPGQDGDISQAEADAFVQEVLTSLWEGVASGDPLRAELETATCMAFPYVLGQRDPADIESFIATVLVNGALRRRTPDGAALLRLLMTLGTQATRRAASQALAERTGEGIHPP